ncbi:hypothetical protein [Entomobacter blattae]|uniref:Uncharacterized protein n=1 Tax=Entomobacter blattae TaxID=2762277 RepID=A0A7H1NU09_9PROT|nr:hypothetical protein [Entomobacter blattae]QNT79269.1 hypothetical protein JGUZn3_20640 [Entomobacter blattae]
MKLTQEHVDWLEKQYIKELENIARCREDDGSFDAPIPLVIELMERYFCFSLRKKDKKALSKHLSKTKLSPRLAFFNYE